MLEPEYTKITIKIEKEDGSATTIELAKNSRVGFDVKYEDLTELPTFPGLGRRPEIESAMLFMSPLKDENGIVYTVRETDAKGETFREQRVY